MNLSEQLLKLHEGDTTTEDSKALVEAESLIESMISEDKGKDILAGLTSEGEPIYMSKDKLEKDKKAKKMLDDEANKWAAKYANKNKDAVTLFHRLITLGQDNEKGAKKQYADLTDAQKSTFPYHPSKTSTFFFPNFNFKGASKLGDAKFLENIKGSRGFMYDPMVFMDRKYKIVFNNLSKSKEVHTASDLIGHDSTLSKLGKDTKVRIYIQKGKVEGVPSNLRLVTAFKKLKDKGYSDVEMVNSDRLTDKEKERLEEVE